MRFAAIVFLFTFGGFVLAGPASSATAAKKKPAGKTSSAVRATRSTSVTSSASKKRGKRTVAAAPRPYIPQSPSSDRYREIQQALAAKGYLKTEPSGVWDQQSADAMRQYQTENNLPPTGKLSAASLIGLGLGGAPAAAVAQPAPPAAK